MMSEIAKFVSITPDAEKTIAYCARVSNPKNQNSDNISGLLKYCIKNKHWSIFEMANLVIEVNTTRAIAPQILRHRTFTFQEFCLAGSARITIQSPNGTIQRVPIENLYNSWNHTNFVSKMARSYDPSLERFISAPIKSVYKTGKKPVYEYTINTKDSSRRIQCTRDHRVFTKEQGFVPFKVAYDNNLTIALNGKEAEPLPYQKYENLVADAWMGSTNYAKKYGIADVTARKWFRIHNVKPEKPNNAAKSRIDHTFSGKLDCFMRWARKTLLEEVCSECGHDGSMNRLELSHKIAHDGNEKLAFDETNLRTLCSKCHRKHDIEMQGKSYGWTLGMSAKWGKIVTEDYLGIQDTYDIEMDHPTHNFVANGVVVHNSQRYAEVDLLSDYIPIPDLRRQDDKDRQNSIDDIDGYLKLKLQGKISEHFEAARKLYDELIAHGTARECARNVLPLATPTRIYMNGTIRSWITYISLREKNGTQQEHKDVALACKKIFCEHLPVVAEALGGLDAPWII